MLDQGCGGFYIEGDSCNLVSDLSKIEKDGTKMGFSSLKLFEKACFKQ